LEEAVPTASASGEIAKQNPGRRRQNAVEEVEAVDFPKRKYGDTAGPYFVPHIYDREFLDKTVRHPEGW
jgi:hypothetical protein